MKRDSSHLAAPSSSRTSGDAAPNAPSALPPGPNNMKVGGRYNWRNQSERLAYIGRTFYPGDRRRWHQFEKVDEPGAVWCEVLDSDLPMFEESHDGLNGSPGSESPAAR